MELIKHLKYASNEVRANKENVLAAVKECGRALEYASAELQSDKEVVLSAVSQDAMALKFVSEDLWNDKEVILAVAAGKNCWIALYEMRDAWENLFSDKEVVLAVVKQPQGFWTLEFLPEEIRNDADVILAATRKHGWALSFASQCLRANKDIVLTAVKNDGSALLHAAAELCADKEVVLTAVTNFGNAIMSASSELQADCEVVLAAVADTSEALAHASEDLRNGGFKAYLESLFNIYSVPVSVYLGTVLFGSSPNIHERILVDAVEKKKKKKSCQENAHFSVLHKLNALGPEGSQDFKKKIAVYAGVPCRDLCGMSWRSVRTALQNLPNSQYPSRSTFRLHSTFIRTFGKCETNTT